MAAVNIFTYVGSTEPLDFQLKYQTPSDVSPVPQPLSGCKVEIHITHDDGITETFNTVDNPTRISITDATLGKVRFNPVAGTFSATTKSCNMMFFITDVALTKAPWPDQDSIRVNVSGEL